MNKKMRIRIQVCLKLVNEILDADLDDKEYDSFLFDLNEAINSRSTY